MGNRVPKDYFDLEVTTSSQQSVEGINAYYEAVLAYKPFPAWSSAAEKAMNDPKCPMARVLAADCAFCQGDAAKSKELMEQLVEDKEKEKWSWRECRYVEAWRSWILMSDPVGCYNLLVEVVNRHPTDLFAVKRGHIMGLILGDGQKMLDIVEIAAKVCGKAVPSRYLHGMWAFGLEQQGCYKDAERIAKEGLAFEASLGPDAWLDHGMAHALYFQGEDRLEDAEEFLKKRSSTWSKEALHPFLYTHCWWHLALLHCERRHFDDCLAIFDERLWPEGSAGLEYGKDPQVQLNALNLLWRLELRQANLSTRWQRVLEGCKGLSLPKDGKGPLQHSDLLLDILLIRALCIDAKQDPEPLQQFLSATQAHAEEMAKGAAGADGRGDAYGALARLVADIFRSDLPDTAETTARRAKAREEVWALQPQWGCLGGSVEQRGILLEAVKGPVVCGQPQ